MNDQPEKTYRILHMEAENILKLHAIDYTPDGKLVEVTGKNGNGKTSLLRAIFMALVGKEAIPAKPIRDGEESARVYLDLGSLKVTLKIRDKGDGEWAHTLVVENEEGAKYSSPQKMLSALIGELAFDPLEFTRMKPKDQFDALKRFVPKFDFDINAKARKDAFDDRTDVNRDIKNLKSQIAGFDISEETPDEEIDVDALTSELENVGKHNSEIESRKMRREALAGEIARERGNADALDAEAAVLRRRADEAEKSAKELREKADASDKRLAEAPRLPDPMDASEIRVKIDSANRINAAVRDKRRMNSLIRQAEEKQKEADKLTAAIEKADADKANAIASAEMPVEGIGFAEDHITLNELPFDQASSAEQLRASIAIAVAANPKLRVIIVKDGALLDDESMGIVREMAETNDVQVWIETVDASRPSALVIEDGRMRDAQVREAAE